MNTRHSPNYVLAATLLVLSIVISACGSTPQGKVVNEIMQHLSAHDAVAAFEHMSKVAKDAGVTSDALAAFIKDYAVLVDGYKSMSVASMNVATSGEATTTEMNGSFSYQDGSTSQFTALLHKEGEAWMVTELNINK